MSDPEKRLSLVKDTVLVPIDREIYEAALKVAENRGEKIELYIENAVNSFVEVDAE